MTYSEMLVKIIKESGLTLKEISEKCKEHGVKIDSSYISKLQTGKQPPASDEVNTALALVCNVDEDTLNYEKYMDKAPYYIAAFITKMLDYFKRTSDQALKSKLPPEMYQVISENLNQQPNVLFIKQFLNQDLPSFNNDKFTFQDAENNEVGFLSGVNFNMTILDDSMEPKIPKGSTIQFDSSQSIGNGDIVVVKIEDEKFIIRRYIEVGSNKILLSENLDYPPVEITSDMEILGKVGYVLNKL
ncbi:hypothetical protein BRE01_14420 [Brevibacillus reuszeri]|uniref:Peptidase S24/S26A/S26B/S26C domain-containing protein n=1 Tax=Brevibacillus reuszeri TaxID=54915 RepID=A0ABQ0TIS0_9BACL|nr:S24 family peptidase [Brevibacillus reuszeri]MED1856561.1 S24 family peptidase [Brevibacillus reuszeri]GED67740.1 hypothetical protein BRE01_14420 [Brevibacillus reuszeri]